MKITSSRKKELTKEFGDNDKDTGKIEVQIAILTDEIKNLTEHLKLYKKDFHSKLGLNKKVSQRTSLLKYLQKKDIDRYNKIIKELKIRK
ncbi:30S ribosomal protein S15 [Candidatus Hepatoplasma crinochetorum]|jgi:small subunit ribosomal protein S15|uniref:Small ribosomal subunit protein uS15 n=1 Tax=Candidatus Hepatoplasma crinochetorum Av TaxID=1427984 RepID=W8GS73_9MOLU|nr:30S ribosomal protein S15 [Candidatus Hepatoplasma crinochetorum]AHK22295.1 30S ribosomal protein S15 [Candidatus Hepatoplasma crinochetorum Av]BDV02881.1 MAG: 30S ribosomal protein S15 [Candidatus Hepatoplasma crinochetorum]